MTGRSVAVWVAAVFAVLTGADAAAAQPVDGGVLPPGYVRLSVGGEYLHVGQEFGPGGRGPLGAPLGGPLDPTTFTPLAPLGEGLADFFTRTEGGPVTIGTGDLLLGDIAVDFGWSTRTVPARLSVGVLPRVEVGVGVAAHRDERLARRFEVGGGALGINPAAQANAALLARMDPAFEALGAAPVLPLAGSALGQELQRRVLAATEEALTLPEDPIDTPGLEAAYDVGPPGYFVSEWRPGDLELDARVDVLRSFPEAFYPAPGAGLEWRVTAGVGVRIPVGERTQANPAFAWAPEVGHAAVRGDVSADLFVGDRGWIGAGGSYARVSAADVTLPVYPGSPFTPREITLAAGRLEPGDEASVWVAPRVRLTEEIAIGGLFSAQRRGAGSQEIAGAVTSRDAATTTSLGFTFRYTTLPGYQQQGGRLPMEVTVGFAGTTSGPVGATLGRLAFVRVSLLHRLWGGAASADPVGAPG